MTYASAAPGWYADPASPFLLRWFDGQVWTQHTAPAPGMAYARATPAAATGAHPDDPVHWLVPTGRTWQSITAGYLALFTIVLFFLGPLTLGFGVWAWRASDRTGRHGRGRAVFAIVVGSVTTVVSVIVFGGMLA